VYVQGAEWNVRDDGNGDGRGGSNGGWNIRGDDAGDHGLPDAGSERGNVYGDRERVHGIVVSYGSVQRRSPDADGMYGGDIQWDDDYDELDRRVCVYVQGT
jgi:hypothetical protein